MPEADTDKSAAEYPILWHSVASVCRLMTYVADGRPMTLSAAQYRTDVSTNVTATFRIGHRFGVPDALDPHAWVTITRR